MSRGIFALLVGINDYSPDVGKLSGSLNDVEHFHGYLTDNFDRSRLHIEVLKDADATRPNIIEQFRSHLCKAKADDVVVFQYCGHGARWKSAKPSPMTSLAIRLSRFRANPPASFPWTTRTSSW